MGKILRKDSGKTAENFRTSSDSWQQKQPTSL